MGDIVHSVMGGVAMVLLVLPLVVLTSAAVLAFAAPLGAAAGFAVRRWSPGGIGWRNFFSSYLSHQVRKKQRNLTGMDGDHGGVPYLSLFAPPPLFVQFEPEQHKILTPKHVSVGPGYKIRPD